MSLADSKLSLLLGILDDLSVSYHRVARALVFEATSPDKVPEGLRVIRTEIDELRAVAGLPPSPVPHDPPEEPEPDPLAFLPRMPT